MMMMIFQTSFVCKNIWYDQLHMEFPQKVFKNKVIQPFGVSKQLMSHPGPPLWLMLELWVDLHNKNMQWNLPKTIQYLITHHHIIWCLEEMLL